MTPFCPWAGQPKHIINSESNENAKYTVADLEEGIVVYFIKRHQKMY